MAERRAVLERIFDEDEHQGHNSHQHEASVWELASHGAIVGRMASLALTSVRASVLALRSDLISSIPLMHR